ncbi:hypothetical protein EJB05_40576, partial [Eragrostis curvula]
ACLSSVRIPSWRPRLDSSLVNGSEVAVDAVMRDGTDSVHVALSMNIVLLLKDSIIPGDITHEEFEELCAYLSKQYYRQRFALCEAEFVFKRYGGDCMSAKEVEKIHQVFQHSY